MSEPCTSERTESGERVLADEFDCAACGVHVYAFPAGQPARTKCATCEWLDAFVEDPEERERMRKDLMG